jgi:hypothetical protein
MRRALSLAALLALLALLAAACVNIDVNGYRAGPAKPGGSITCKGACNVRR